MSFLERIKGQLKDSRLGNGYGRQHCKVDRRDLHELIHHYEVLDSGARAAHGSKDLAEHLHLAITALYHKQDKDGELTLSVIMNTLAPLIDDRRKEALKNKHFELPRFHM